MIILSHITIVNLIDFLATSLYYSTRMHYVIRTITGEITSRVSLDREVKSSYNLQVRVQDPYYMGKEPAQKTDVVILIGDVNDVVPTFIFPEKGF